MAHSAFLKKINQDVRRFGYRNLQNDSTKKVIHIKYFGGVGNGKTNATSAFQKAAEYLQQNGGTLIIDPGTYIVGKQYLSKSFDAGFSYNPEPILNFINAKNPIVISGYKAILKAADGLNYGSFNPLTGLVDSVRTTGKRLSYNASAYIFIVASGCTSISIRGLTLDGNSGMLNISPPFDKYGNQLSATGITLYKNKKAEIIDCYIHHCALDAIIITWPGLKNTDPIYPHTIKHVIARFNGRQGLSWVGGNSLTVINSEFSSTGKSTNKGLPVVGLPSAGIDIENEDAIIKNGNFINCIIYNNAGYGVSSIGNDTYNINFKKVTFIGTTKDPAFPKSQNFSFDSCIFVGQVVGIHGSSEKTKANYFKNCLFTMDKKKSPNGQVFGKNSAFYDAENVIFNNCIFNSGTGRLPVFNHKEIEFIDCKFIQNSNEDFRAIATFKGTTEFLMKGKGKINASEGSFEGKIIYNNQVYTDINKLPLK
ncbi:MAG: hypothetical protein M3139_00310 [Bacteroidota bacterium]|nr:hypothetical protein [Bacteroidota bacterium]